MIKRFYNYYVSEDKELVKKFKNVLGFTPANLNLYKIAFSHKSMNNRAEVKGINNERLEYLGDSVLSTVVAEYLFRKYPIENEGFLTKMRSKIVKRNTLNKIADQMGLDILLSHFIEARVSSAMKGNALEALIGAIYIEKGYTSTKNYIVKHVLIKYLDMDSLESTEDNHKSRLLEHCQKTGTEVEFKLVSRYKVDKRDRFKIAVHINGQQLGMAEDFNKKAAEQKASSIAIRSIIK